MKVTAVRARLPFIAALVAAALLGAGVVWALRDEGRTTHRIRGVTNGVNIDGTAIGLTHDGRVGQGFNITGADWQDCSGAGCGPTYENQGEHPACVAPLSRGQTLELVLVDGIRAPGAEGEAGYPVNKVVFVRCLSKPAHVDSLTG